MLDALIMQLTALPQSLKDVVTDRTAELLGEFGLDAEAPEISAAVTTLTVAALCNPDDTIPCGDGEYRTAGQAQIWAQARIADAYTQTMPVVPAPPASHGGIDELFQQLSEQLAPDMDSPLRTALEAQGQLLASLQELQADGDDEAIFALLKAQLATAEVPDEQREQILTMLTALKDGDMDTVRAMMQANMKNMFGSNWNLEG